MREETPIEEAFNPKSFDEPKPETQPQSFEPHDFEQKIDEEGEDTAEEEAPENA